MMSAFNFFKQKELYAGNASGLVSIYMILGYSSFNEIFDFF